MQPGGCTRYTLAVKFGVSKQGDRIAAGRVGGQRLPGLSGEVNVTCPALLFGVHVPLASLNVPCTWTTVADFRMIVSGAESVGHR